MFLNNLYSFLTVPPEYDFNVNVLPWIVILLHFILLITYSKIRKLKKENEKLNEQIQKPEAKSAEPNQEQRSTNDS